MDYIEWNESLNVEIDKFNKQHKELIEITNRLFQSFLENRLEEIEKNFLNLIEHSKLHFAEEEKWMLQYEYPHYQNHKKVHESLLNQILYHYNKYKKGEFSLNLHSFIFFKHWLVDHIISDDKKYGEFFRSKGISNKN